MRKTILLTALCLCAAFASYGQNADGSATSDNTVKSEKMETTTGTFMSNSWVRQISPASASTRALLLILPSDTVSDFRSVQAVDSSTTG